MTSGAVKFLQHHINVLSNRKLCHFTKYLQTITTSNQEIIYDTGNHSFAFVGLNRPKSKNAIGKTMLSELKTVIESINNSKTIRCIVIGSLVPNVFCAGADLKERKQIPESDVASLVGEVRGILQSFSKIPVPTICAIDGPAFGGGMEIALACDLRFAVENVLMGLPETKLAIIPGAGGTQRLPRLVGISKAKEMIFTGKPVTGKEALAMGLVNETVTQNSDGNAALLHAFSVAEMISGNGPIGVRMAKAAIDCGMEQVLMKDALLVEEKCYDQVIPTSDRMEGLKAFQEKRKPNYEGK